MFIRIYSWAHLTAIQQANINTPAKRPTNRNLIIVEIHMALQLRRTAEAVPKCSIVDIFPSQ